MYDFINPGNNIYKSIKLESKHNTSTCSHFLIEKISYVSDISVFQMFFFLYIVHVVESKVVDTIRFVQQGQMRLLKAVP